MKDLEYYKEHIEECPVDILRVLYAEVEADLYAANNVVNELVTTINDLQEDCMSIYIKGVTDCNSLWRENVKKMIEDFKIISNNIREQEFPCISSDLERNDYAVKMLEELLGDKTNGATKNN